MKKPNYILVKTILLATLMSLTSCGSRKVSIDKYKASAEVERIEYVETQTNISEETETNTITTDKTIFDNYTIKFDEIIVEEKDKTTTYKNAVLRNEKTFNDKKVDKKEKAYKIERSNAKTSRKSKDERTEETLVKEVDKKQYNVVALLVQIFFAVLIIYAVINVIKKRFIK